MLKKILIKFIICISGIFLSLGMDASYAQWDCVDGITSDGTSFSPNAPLETIKYIDDETDFTYEPTGETYRLLSGNISQNSMNLQHGGTNANSYPEQYMAELDSYTEGMDWTVEFNGTILHGYSICNAGSNAWTKPFGAVKNGPISGTYNGCSCSLDKQRWVLYGKPENDSSFSGWIDKNTNCRQMCPFLCAQTIATNSTFRQSVLNNSCEIPDENGGGTGGDTPTPVVNCEENQFKYNNECINAKFTITTNAINYFEFRISASGRFYVDWGDGEISRYLKTDVDSVQIYHTYSGTSASRTIRIGGLADGYSTAAEIAAISFANWTGQTNTYDAIEYISGSLADIFPTIDNGDSFATQPRFWRTFNGCTNLKSPLDSELFKNLRGKPVEHMFYATFMGCENIPGPIPERFFGSVFGQPASYMFDGTFSGCTKLGSENGIPTYTIPENLFENIRGTTVAHMFPGTFMRVEGIRGPIPENLFANISGEPKERIFAATFSGCKNLNGTIPENLFKNIRGDLVDKAFRRTFKDTYSLEGWVPPRLFANINNDNHQGEGMLHIFEDSGLITACPENYYQVQTEFDEFWDGRVSCQPCPDGFVSNYNSVGATSCHLKQYECYSDKYLRVGENESDKMCLSEDQLTHPALAIKIGSQVYYVNMKQQNLPINSESSKKMRVLYNNDTYNVYDNTLQ